MNRLHRLTPATLIAATLAALVLVQANDAVAAPAQAVVHLPTVHVVAKRASLQPMQIVQLPTVQIVAKRSSLRPAAVVVARINRADAL
jgi:hypothetical protein